MAKRKSYWDKARNQADAIDKVVCKFISGNLVEEVEYELDDQSGYKSRVFPKDAELKDEEARELLLGNRAVELEEVLATIGKSRFKNWLKQGYLTSYAYSKELFMVTRKAAERFDLPKVLNCEFPEAK